jgi:hypothetical protein
MTLTNRTKKNRKLLKSYRNYKGNITNKIHVPLDLYTAANLKSNINH